MSAITKTTTPDPSRIGALIGDELGRQDKRNVSPINLLIYIYTKICDYCKPFRDSQKYLHRNEDQKRLGSGLNIV